MASNYKKSVPLQALLLTALAFTLSAVPGQGAHRVTSLSSHSESADSYSDEFLGSDSIFTSQCDVQNTLGEGKKLASCSLKSRTYSSDSGDFRVGGRVKVEKKTVSRLNTEGTAMESSEKLVITLTTSTRGLAERTRTTYAATDEWSSINSTIADLFSAQAKEMADSVLQHQRVVNCEITRSGATIATEKRADCRLEKLSTMNDEQAEAYYNKYFKGDLERLLQSENTAEQAAGIQMLEILKSKNIRSPYVQAALGNAELYAKYRTDIARLESGLAQMTPEQRAEAIRKLAWYKSVMGSEFRTRRDMLDNRTFSDSSLNGRLIDNLGMYNAQLSQRLDAIAQMHTDVTNNTSGRNGVRVGPQFSGQVATGYQISQPGSPVVQPQGVVNDGTGAPVAGRGVRGNTSGNGTIPGVGSRVNIK